MKQITIIIPVFNGEKTIGRSLASLISNREYISEIIIVDDHCTDDTIGVVKKYNLFFDNIRIIRSIGFHNLGSARKTGILMAKGKWITFIDADDCITASSLRYVSENLDSSSPLLCCKTIYYESGSFNANSIEYSDTSCGGNFYLTDYLLKNNLYPDESISLIADEHYNEKVIKMISIQNLSINHYDYPVYEVHHDIDDGLSYALSNWVDYLCRYRLLYKQKIGN